MAYQLSPYTGDLISGGLAGLGSAAGAIISALRGAPAVMPGGAALVGGAARLATRALPYAVGAAAGYLTTRGGGGARGPSVFVCEDPMGNEALVRKLGAALAYRGDIQAVKRLKRARSTINSCLGGVGRRSSSSYRRRRPR